MQGRSDASKDVKMNENSQGLEDPTYKEPTRLRFRITDKTDPELLAYVKESGIETYYTTPEEVKFDELYKEIDDYLGSINLINSAFGVDEHGNGDYYIVGDFYPLTVSILFWKWESFDLDIINGLRGLLSESPDWIIRIVFDTPEMTKDSPKALIIVRWNEVEPNVDPMYLRGPLSFINVNTISEDTNPRK